MERSSVKCGVKCFVSWSRAFLGVASNLGLGTFCVHKCLWFGLTKKKVVAALVSAFSLHFLIYNPSLLWGSYLS